MAGVGDAPLELVAGGGGGAGAAVVVGVQRRVGAPPHEAGEEARDATARLAIATPRLLPLLPLLLLPSRGAVAVGRGSTARTAGCGCGCTPGAVIVVGVAPLVTAAVDVAAAA